MEERRSTCPYCGVGCGVILSPDGRGGLAVRGDPAHPANRGRLCIKGAALGETVGHEDRLLRPRIGGRGVGWDTAMAHVAHGFREAIETHGPGSVALYCSGQMLTEDYYVANKLMKGFVGTANIDTNSRLCMASTVAGHKRAFGTDTVPQTYDDIELADLVVIVGSNLAWCHPVLFQRLKDAKAARPRMRVVAVDPRRTATCDIADRHLRLAAGTDIALFNGLLAEIAARGAVDADYALHVSGATAAIAAARADDPAATGIAPADLAAFYDEWIAAPRTVTLFSQGVNQSDHGTDKVGAIVNCHLATGRIGKPGAGPLSVTGQPNAMGGREVGGLANTLACHMDLDDPAHRAAVREFWDAPRIARQPGLSAVEMFAGVRSGKIRAIWIIHTNPAVTMPEADMVGDAIAACPFTVVSDITAQTDTARLADVVLPAAGWAEKDGTVTNSDRTISRQRAVLPPPGEARPDWAALAELGRRLGHVDAFDYNSPVEIFREHAALSGIAGRFGLDFDISDLATLTDADYAAMAPVRWPASGRRQGGRFFGDGGFFTPDGLARMVAVHQPSARPLRPDFPFRLNTGRIRDQWHTMTRTGLSPRLGRHLAEPFVEIHPRDAIRRGIAPADLVEIASPHGRAVVRAWVTDRVRQGEVFAPIHWTGETAPTARIDALIAARTDPISRQPDSKAQEVALSPYPARWFAFAVTRTRPRPGATYWALGRAERGYRLELAGLDGIDDWEGYARRLFDLPDAAAQSLSDPARETARLAFFEGGEMAAAIFAGPRPVALSRGHLVDLLGGSDAAPLPGRPMGEVQDTGPVLCSCLNVGVTTILEAIEQGRASSVEDVGAVLGAGTSCGSCRPEIATLLRRATTKEAAE